MLGLGIWEILIILVTALVVLGPEKLPQVARQLARLLGELRRVSDDVRRNFDDVMAEPHDVNRHDAPRPLPAGAQAAHAGTSPAAIDADAPDRLHTPTQGAQAAQTGAHPQVTPDAAEATRPAAAEPRS